MSRRHPEDHLRYQELLEGTCDAEDLRHRDQAIKLLTEELTAKAERVAEYALARAVEVANGFDRSHQPEIHSGQMALDIDTYLVLGDNERVPVTDATPKHTRQWLDISNINKARQDAAHAAKTLHGYKLLAIQDEHNCSMWKAEQILRGDQP
jgi:hypothetical protein